MRPALTYTSARILLFVASLGLLYLTGARGLLLLALALLASGILSYVLLSRQRDAMSLSLFNRLGVTKTRIRDFGGRIDEGTKAEDQD
jgi:Mn2+/Fe2+ NRAMP family transporter